MGLLRFSLFEAVDKSVQYLTRAFLFPFEMAGGGMALGDIVVVKEQAVAFDATVPLAVRIVCGGGKGAIRGAAHLERLAQIVHYQSLVSLLGDCHGLVGVDRVEQMVRPRGGMVFAITFIRAQPCVAVIIVFVSTSDKDSHAGG